MACFCGKWRRCISSQYQKEGLVSTSHLAVRLPHEQRTRDKEKARLDLKPSSFHHVQTLAPFLSHFELTEKDMKHTFATPVSDADENIRAPSARRGHALMGPARTSISLPWLGESRLRMNSLTPFLSHAQTCKGE